MGNHSKVIIGRARSWPDAWKLTNSGMNERPATQCSAEPKAEDTQGRKPEPSFDSDSEAKIDRNRFFCWKPAPISKSTLDSEKQGWPKKMTTMASLPHY